MMKKHLALLLLLAVPAIVVKAQLKVDSTGNVYIKKSTGNNDAILSIGNLPNSTIYDTGYFDIGIHVQKHGTLPVWCHIGLLGECERTPSSGSGYSIGVWGNGGNGSNYKNVGVLGTIEPGETGAGISGTAEGGPAPSMEGSYAGFFYGDTYVDGPLTVWEFYNLSDMRLKENVEPLAKSSIKLGGPLERLQNLEVFSYTLKKPHSENAASEKRSEVTEKFAELKHRDAARRHYGVSAQELQKIFPDLVREGQDGYLTVNYTEMVPILLLCIQELKEKIDEMQNYDISNVSMKASAINGIPSNVGTTDVQLQLAKTATLKQNTPNPFTERTTINFTLPDDAKNAYIYIFDMQGKMLKQLPISSSQTSVTINGYELQAGLYLYSLVINGQEIDTKRMILLR